MEKNSTEKASIRRATRDDVYEIARLFMISSDGLAPYIWNKKRAPDTDVLDHGAARYRRDDADFSWQNCLLAEVDGRVAGMAHAFLMETDGTDPEDDRGSGALRGLGGPGVALYCGPCPV